MSIKPVIEPITLLAGMSSVGTIVTDTTFFTYSGDSNDWNTTYTLVSAHSAIWEAGNGNWDFIYNRPTTLSGYGIIDAAPSSLLTLVSAKSSKWDSNDPVYNSVTADSHKATQATIKAINQTSYILLTSDNGKVIKTQTINPTEIIIPSGLGAGFSCLVLQTNTGQVTISGSNEVEFNGVIGDSLIIDNEQGGAFIFAYDVDTFNINGSVSGSAVDATRENLIDSVNALVSSNSAEWAGGHQAYTWVHTNSADPIFDVVRANRYKTTEYVINAQTSISTYTLVSNDNGKIIKIDTTTPCVVVIPDNFPVGFSCTVIQTNTGSVKISAVNGVSINGEDASSVDIAGIYGAAVIFEESPNSYNVGGSLSGGNFGNPNYVIDANLEQLTNVISSNSAAWGSNIGGYSWVQANSSNATFDSVLVTDGIFDSLTADSITSGVYKSSSYIINAQTNIPTYTLLSNDNGKIITINNTTPCTVIIPTGFPVGFSCTVIQKNTGSVKISAAGGVSINGDSSSYVDIAGAYNAAVIFSETPDSYEVGGGLSGGIFGNPNYVIDANLEDLTNIISANSGNWNLNADGSSWVQANSSNSTFDSISATIVKFNALTADSITSGAYKSSGGIINSQTTTNYTLLASDNGKIITMDNSSPSLIIVPQGFNAGFSCTIIQLGTGQVTISANSGVTINGIESNDIQITGQHGGSLIFAYALNSFNIAGSVIGDNLGDPVDWSLVINTPTTLAGYGITDAATTASLDGLNSLTPTWQSNYNTVNTNSANWNSTYNTTNTNSGYWKSGYSTVSSNSAAWSNSNAATSIVSSNSANWDSNYNTVNTNSGNWKSTYNTVNANSASWKSNWTTVNSNSANWESTYNTVNTTSATWGGSNSTTSTVSSNSGKWDAAYTSVTANSGTWSTTPTFSTVRVTDTVSVTGTLNGTTLSADKHVGTANTVNTIVATTYILLSSDNGKVLTFNNSSPITLSVPTGLGIGYSTMFVQLGNGQISISAGSGITVNSYKNYTKTAGQFAGGSLFAYAANTFVLAGSLSS